MASTTSPGRDPSLSVCLTFDFDAISVWIGSMRSPSPGNISRGEFGRLGAERLLALLAETGIQGTWFITGHTAATYPAVARKVAEAGHEIGHHNYCHENPRTLEPAEERAVMERAGDTLERVTGHRPRGYRSPAWDLSDATIPLLVEMGFEYDSSLMGADFDPYYVRAGDEIVTDGPFRFGEEVPLVEMPVDWSLDDWPYFGLNWPAHHVGLRSPGEVFETWRDEFDWAYANVPGGVFTLTMHPQIIGRGSRLAMLDRLIEHMAEHPGVRFVTLGEAARSWREGHPFDGAAR